MAVRAVIQRVSEASVLVGGEPVGSLDRPGLLHTIRGFGYRLGE